MSEKKEQAKQSTPLSGIDTLKIALGRLLLIEPMAYLSLCSMFPCKATNIDEISELKLPGDYAVIMMPERQLFLISTKAHRILRYVKRTFSWHEM